MKYLNLAQTLKKLKSIPESYQPQEIPQLSDACMKKKIIPVFIFNGYSLTYVCGTGDSAEYINIPVRGYLTHESISNIFNWHSKREKKVEITEAVIYELTQQEELISKGDRIALAKKTFHHLMPVGNIKSEHFDVKLTKSTRLYSSSDGKDAKRMRQLGGVEISQNDLLFPIEQVQDYIDSFVDNAEEDYLNHIERNNLDLQNEIKRLKEEISMLNKTDKKAVSTVVEESEKTLIPKDSAYYLIAVMKDLLLNPDITSYYFQTDNDKGRKEPTQSVLVERIASMHIKNLGTRNISGILADANVVYKENLHQILLNADEMLIDAEKDSRT